MLKKKGNRATHTWLLSVHITGVHDDDEKR